MQAGTLRHRITIERPGQAQDAAGQTFNAWFRVAEDYAEVETLSGREFFSAQRMQSPATVRVRMRYRDSIDTTMRVRYGVRVLDITAVNPDPRSRELELMCVEHK